MVCAVATYVPLLLEGLGRDNAVWVGDHRTPCHDMMDQPGLMPVPIAPAKCVVKLGNIWIDTSSLPLYTFSASVLVQTVVVISISGIADRGAHRKALLVGFAIFGACATILLGYIGKKQYYIAALLAIIANASFGAVSVCGNAFLPQLIGIECQRLVRLRKTAFERFHGAFPEQAITASPIEMSHLVPLEEKARIGARLSGKGTAVGYGAALFVQIVTMALLVLYKSADKHHSGNLQLVIALIGWWWLLGQIPVSHYLPKSFVDEDLDSAPPIPDENTSTEPTLGDEIENISLSLAGQVIYGWQSLFRTIHKARKLKDITTFLIGWFLLSDAVTTINSTAVLFARTNLQMATPALALIGLITVIFAICGALVFGRQKSQNRSLVIIALLGSLVPIYGIIGFFQPWIGLKHPWETYVLAAWYGVALGALNATTRSLYSLLIPKGHEVMFFALYSVTDKGSSILGPTITGMITDYTHNIRYTFYFLLGMMLLAAFVFSQVDYERGQQEAFEESSNALALTTNI